MGVTQYYAKLIGYASHQNSWEALAQAQDILGDFLSIVPDPPPPLTQCQAKLCIGAATSEFPRCSDTPRSTRCTKHSCVPCGPATHCPCQPHNKRHRPLSPPDNHPVPPSPNRPTSPAPPNITRSHAFSHPRARDDTTAHVSPPSPPRPSNESPPTPRAPSNRRSRPKNALLETEMFPPPSPKRQRLRPEPPTKRQPKRTHPDSEMTPPR